MQSWPGSWGETKSGRSRRTSAWVEQAARLHEELTWYVDSDYFPVGSLLILRWVLWEPVTLAGLEKPSIEPGVQYFAVPSAWQSNTLERGGAADTQSHFFPAENQTFCCTYLGTFFSVNKGSFSFRFSQKTKPSTAARVFSEIKGRFSTVISHLSLMRQEITAYQTGRADGPDLSIIEIQGRHRKTVPN